MSGSDIVLVILAVVVFLLIGYMRYLKRRIEAIQVAMVGAYSTMGSLLAMGEATGTVFETMNDANMAHAEVHRELQAMMDAHMAEHGVVPITQKFN